MMNSYEKCENRYEELENIIDTLVSLRNETEDTYYKGRLQDIIEEATTEQEELEKALKEFEKAEKEYLNQEYEKSVL